MAATAKLEELKQQPLRRNSSLTRLPPSMSELRVVLLGNSWSERSSVGNLMLGEDKFNTQEESDCCVRVDGRLKGAAVVLINTPDLLLPDVSEDKRRRYVEKCVRLSDPGPHVFLLVLQPEDFTEEQKLRLCRILQLFSDRSLDQSLVLISAPREETSAKNYMNHPALKSLIEKCRYRYLKQKNLELRDLLTHLGKLVKENYRELQSCDEYEDGEPGLTMLPVSKPVRPVLNLVLFGRRGAEKTSAVQAILGQTELGSASSSSECVEHQGEVCGRWVSLVELPALSGKAPQTVMEESFRCVSLCGPEGVHAFILVLPVAPLTDDDKAELESIHNTFSSAVSDFTMILFTVDSDSTHPAVNDFVRENRDVQQLSQRCGGGCFILRGKQQIPELMEAVEKMRVKGSRCFTMDMFTRAQMEKVTKLTELQVVKRSPEPLRMVLMGKIGSGKSSTINTVLGAKHFEPRIPPKPPVTTCEKVSGEVEGRPVAVVNTPPLFHPTLSDGAFEREIKNSISLLSPGPHVFILVLQLGNITPKESVDLIKQYFGRRSQNFILLLFTRGDDLGNESFESYITRCPASVKRLINDCGGRYQVFNNKDSTNTTQVRELLLKVENIVKENGGNCFNSEMCDDTDRLERIIKEQEEELKTLKKKLSEQTAETKLREKQLKEKDSSINKELEERRKDEEKRWRRQEDALRLDWKRKLEASDKICQAEREQRENAERKLELCRKEMKRDREAWDKEKKDMWERTHQELRTNLEEEKSSFRKLQDEYQCKRKKWTYSLVTLGGLLLVLLLLCYHFIMA